MRLGLHSLGWSTDVCLLSIIDLFSALHQGNLDRIEFEFGERSAAEYLGKSATSLYTVHLTLGTFKKDYGVVAWETDDSTPMTFAYHWSGISNMLHGIDCGNTPVEAANSVHASFEKQITNWQMRKQTPLHALNSAPR